MRPPTNVRAGMSILDVSLLRQRGCVGRRSRMIVASLVALVCLTGWADGDPRAAPPRVRCRRDPLGSGSRRFAPHRDHVEALAAGSRRGSRHRAGSLARTRTHHGVRASPSAGARDVHHARAARAYAIDVDQRPPPRIPSITVHEELGVIAIQSARGGRLNPSARPAPCRIRILVNGLPMPFGMPLPVTSPKQVHAIEVYSGPATVPPELVPPGEDAFCGVAA